jgi:hypothetical protein
VFLPWWARVAAAAVLLGGGIGLGMLVHGSGAQAAGNSASTGNTGTGSASTGIASTGNATTTSNTTLGPVASPPPSCTPHPPGTTPELCVSMPYGDGDTVFVIHGSGFRPSKTITVQLVGVGVPPEHLVTSPDHPVTDRRGTFNYAIDQGHRFFSGPIPAGVYHVVVTGSSGGRAGASFRVNPPSAGNPPLGPPAP